MLELFKVRGTALASQTRTLLANLLGVSDDERADGQAVLFPHGFVSRPSVTDTLFAVAMRVGDGIVALCLRDKGSSAFSPTLQEGETRVFTLGGATIRLLGAEIVFNGGSLKVARVTDPVRIGTLAGVSATGGPVTFTFQPVDAAGAPAGAPQVLATVTLAGVVSNAGGAANVKA